MFQTMLVLPESTRKNVIALLEGCVADGIQLTQFAKQAHWNLKGPNFIALHELFDKIHEDLEGAVDLLAERIAQFGGYVDGTCKAVVKMTSLSDYPQGLVDESDHVQALAGAVAEFGGIVRGGIDKAAAWRDAGTADILTGVSRMLDKTLWILESHISRSVGQPIATSRTPRTKRALTKTRVDDSRRPM